MAASMDLLTQVAATPTAKPRMYKLLSSLLSDPGVGSPDAPRFQALLYSVADLSQLLADDADLVPIVKPLAGLLDPQVAVGALSILRRGLPTDDKQILLQVGKNLFTLTPAVAIQRFSGRCHERNQPQRGRTAGHVGQHVCCGGLSSAAIDRRHLPVR